MAQTYVSDVPDGTTNILQDNINGRNNENTLRSSFSGTLFPDTPVAGQHCYRTDTGIEYIYDGATWVEVAATNTLGLDVAAAKGTLNNLSSRLNVSINPDGTLKDPTTANVDEFKVSNLTPTYVDATTFSVPDDLTGIFTEGRILKITDGAEIKYLSVVSSTFDTVTNVLIDGTITASISAVDYSLAQYGLPSASATVKGVVKVGSNISVAEGVVSVPDATETVKGVVELATPAEVLAGEDDERVVTSATAPRVYNQRLVIKSSSLFDGTLDLSSGITSDSVTAGAGTAKATVNSGNFTPGVTGWYKVTIIGGGGGGGHKPSDGTPGYVYSGAAGGGASGCIKTVHLKLVAGTDYAYAIGGAGSGGHPVGDIPATDGGTTTFNGISALGGGAGIKNHGGGMGGEARGIGSFSGGVGGLQTCAQAAGETKYWTGGAGGGMGGGQGSNSNGDPAVYYGGGGGGAGSWNSTSGVAGGAGFQGCVILEFYDPSV